MTRTPFSLASQIKINLYSLWAFCLSVAAYALWPSSMKWWGLYLICTFMALSAFALVIEVIKCATKLHVRERAALEFERLGEAPKSTELVSTDSLKKAGMM